MKKQELNKKVKDLQPLNSKQEEKTSSNLLQRTYLEKAFAECVSVKEKYENERWFSAIEYHFNLYIKALSIVADYFNQVNYFYSKREEFISDLEKRMNDEKK